MNMSPIVMSSADTWLYNCTGILFQDILSIKKIKKWFFIGFLGFSALAYSAAIIMPSIVNYAVIYAIVYMVIGSLLVFD